MRKLEQSNSQLERMREQSDCLYEALMARDGKLLMSIYHDMLVPMIMSRILEFRAAIASGVVQKNEQTITSTHLDELERELHTYQTQNNDNTSRCYRQMMLFVALYNEPALRDFFARQPPPTIPFSECEEANVALADVNTLAPAVLSPKAFVSFLQQSLRPTIDNYTKKQESVPIDPELWVEQLTIEYISRLPLQLDVATGQRNK